MTDESEKPTTDERWQRSWQLFHRALELPDGQRAAFLASKCSGDDELLREVTELLRNHRLDDNVFDRPPLFSGPDEPSGKPEGMVIGAYELIRRLGEGGMGVVYEAHQQEPVRRRVALKLIKHTAPGAELVARFDAERQALALMTHPGVARVLDFGVTDRGQPFYVMEFVEGLPITEFCERGALPVRERIELLGRACDAVHHAHQKGVIHRDLKPSNILVTDDDGIPQPKIIDFGVAKLLEPELAPETVYTRTGAMLGTPEYMSPEQWTNPTDIDTRTDVYSLGVVLYEMLTGELPFRVRGRPIAEAARLVLQSEAKRPSTRVGADSSPERDPAEHEHGQISPELDWVTLRALEKDRERRYGSAADLATDLRRYLDRRPVAAGPPGLLYRARKFVWRHVYGVAASLAFILALLAGFVGTVYMARVAARERDAARLEAETSRATVAFLEELLGGTPENTAWSTPSTATERNRSVLDVIREAEETLPGKFPDQPLVEADLAITLGRSLTNLGEQRAGERLLRHGVALYADRLPEDDPELLDAYYELALNLRYQAQCPEAEPIFRRVFDQWTETLGAESRQSLKAALGLGVCLGALDRLEEQQDLFEFVTNVFRRELDPAWEGPPLEILVLDRLAGNPRTMDEGARSRHLALLREFSRTREARLGPTHSATLDAKIIYGQSLAYSAPTEALTACTEALEASVDPEYIYDAVICQWNAWRLAGAWNEAIAAAEEIMRMDKEIFGIQDGGHGDAGLMIMTLGLAGRHEEAETLARARYRELANDDSQFDSPQYRTVLRDLLHTLEAQKKFEEAETLLRLYAEDERLTPARQRRAATWAVRLYMLSGETEKLEAAKERLRALQEQQPAEPQGDSPH